MRVARSGRRAPKTGPAAPRARRERMMPMWRRSTPARGPGRPGWRWPAWSCRPARRRTWRPPPTARPSGRRRAPRRRRPRRRGVQVQAAKPRKSPPAQADGPGGWPEQAPTTTEAVGGHVGDRMPEHRARRWRKPRTSGSDASSATNTRPRASSDSTRPPGAQRPGTWAPSRRGPAPGREARLCIDCARTSPARAGAHGGGRS